MSWTLLLTLAVPLGFAVHTLRVYRHQRALITWLNSTDDRETIRLLERFGLAQPVTYQQLATTIRAHPQGHVLREQVWRRKAEVLDHH